jgi:PAS domain S-box-containing protein
MVDSLDSAIQRHPLCAELQAALNLLPAFAWYCNASGGLTFLNERGSDYLGLPIDHPLRLGIDTGAEWDSHIALLHPDDHEEARRVWSTLLRTGCAGDVSFRVRNAEGGYRWHLSRAEPVSASDGTLLYWIGVNLDIEDRKQTELYLAEGQRLAHTGSWAFNAAGFDYWSPELFRIYGLDPSGKAPTVEEYMELVHPADREFVAETIQKMFAEGRGFDFTKRIVRPDGETRRVRCVGVPATHGGAVQQFIGTGMDVTEHELLTQELGRREAYLAEAQRLSHTGSFGWKSDTGEIIWSDETYRIFEYDREVTPTIDLVAQRVHPEDSADFQSIIERASGGTPAFEHAYRLLLPDGRVKHVHALAHATQDASGNREFIGAVTDITERKTAEDNIRRLVDAGILGIFFANVDGAIVEANQAFLQLLQYDREDLVSGRLRWADLTPAEWRDRDERALTEFLETGVFHYEKEYFRKDGSRVPVLVGGARLQSPNLGVVFVLDLSEQKRAEEKIRMSESYLAEAQRLSHTGSWAWNPSPNKDIRYWSEECYRVLGFDPAGPLPRFEEFFQKIHPDDQAASRERFEKAIGEKADFELDYRIVHPDKRVRDIHIVGHAALDRSGDLHEFVGTVIDITERKRAEEELRASESKYRHLVDTTPAFVHTALPNGELDFFNCGWLEYVGVPMTDLLGWRWTSAIHPEDVEGLVATWRASLESGEPFVAESRVRRADGEYRWFLHRKEPLRNEAGEIVKWYGSSIEIEERKIAEEKIREQGTELRQILDLTPQHIGVLGPDGSPLYANQVALEYFGVTIDQWLDRESRLELVHPDDREHFLGERKNRFLEGAPHEFEARLLRHDGKFRCFLFRLSPLKDERGHITRWYGTATDIEERNRVEEGIRKENIALRAEIAETSMFEEIVGESTALQAVLTRVAKVAPTDSTVLITGETGTGKELIARAIHRRSRRSSQAFVGINCAAIPRDLIASELFGHEKGAFTGATQQRLGRFELASGGTIFLDEVGELPAETQIALLRVLQEHEFERVGGTRQIPTDVRVVAATNRDLQAAIAAGTFRSDLFYRLNVFPIEMPSLRERGDDIPLLVEYFIDRYARKAGKSIRSVSKKTLGLFESYPWPGNIRELQNVIERSVILCETEIFSIDESWLPQQPFPTASKEQIELPQRLLAQEKDMIEAALKESRGCVSGPSGAAARLGIPRSTLESKIRTLKIDKNRFRPYSGT